MYNRNKLLSIFVGIVTAVVSLVIVFGGLNLLTRFQVLPILWNSPLVSLLLGYPLWLVASKKVYSIDAKVFTLCYGIVYGIGWFFMLVRY